MFVMWLLESICLPAAREARNNKFQNTTVDRWLGTTTPKLFLVRFITHLHMYVLEYRILFLGQMCFLELSAGSGLE